ncbi:MAG: DUF2332 domain-containing protein [Kiloniellales bacterium]|nr:DUF2332 domain-containing protein [Kiloniellales bacterium]
MSEPDHAALADRFRSFAERECRGISPLYHAIALGVAEDPALLALASARRDGQPPANMLLGAVHALLLQGPDDEPLAAFYPSLTASPAPADGAFPAFQAFCRRHADKIAEILRTRVVSTNEVQRCACLLPGFAAVAEMTVAPLHIIEIGASAGLNLFWDHYGYDYGAAGFVGDPEAPLILRCTLHGRAPTLPRRLPAVASRIGIDPVPLDPADPADVAWLRALIWPEQHERAVRLETAAAIAARLRPTLLAGDGQARLPEALDAIGADEPICLVHSFTLNQFAVEARSAFLAQLDRLGELRMLYRLGLEWGAAEAPALTLTRHGKGMPESRRLALCDAHGAWIGPP